VTTPLKLSNPISEEEVTATFDPETMPNTAKFPEAQRLSQVQNLSLYFPRSPVQSKLYIVVHIPEGYADAHKKQRLAGNERTAR
jgi:hypothetical protein